MLSNGAVVLDLARRIFIAYGRKFNFSSSLSSTEFPLVAGTRIGVCFNIVAISEIDLLRGQYRKESAEFALIHLVHFFVNGQRVTPSVDPPMRSITVAPLSAAHQPITKGEVYPSFDLTTFGSAVLECNSSNWFYPPSDYNLLEFTHKAEYTVASMR